MEDEMPKGGLLGGCVGAPRCAAPPSSSASSPPSATPLTSSSSSSKPTPAVAIRPGEVIYGTIPDTIPIGPATYAPLTGGSSSSSSSTADSGNRAAASASPTLQPSPSSSSSPPAAAVASLVPGFDILLPVIKPIIWDYFGTKADRGKLAIAGLIPREQGHLLLSYERTGEMPLSAGRIPPVGESPSVPIPTNKMSFCTENTDAVIGAINSQWNTINPWRLTVLTVKLNPAAVAGSVNKTIIILDGIKTTLGHVKTLIVVVGQLAFFFTSNKSADPCIIEVPKDVCELNSYFLWDTLSTMAIFEFSTEGSLCHDVLLGFRNTAAAPSPLTGIIMELHDDATWDWYNHAVPATGPTDPRLHLMVSIAEYDVATRNAFWGNSIRVGSLRLLSYFFYDVHFLERGGMDRIPMDFSGCTRLVEVFVRGSMFRFNLLRLPTAVGHLENLWLDLINYDGPSISLGEGRVYPRLRHLCLSHKLLSRAVAPVAGAGAAAVPIVGASVLTISSDQFPALQVFKSLYCQSDEVLDFSNFRTSGLSLNLMHFTGTIRMPAPEIQMGTLTLDSKSVDRICSFDDILPRFLSLDLTCYLTGDLLPVFDRVNRLPLNTSKQPESAHLKKLVIRKTYGESLRFGAFPELQSLTLEDSPAILDGANFPSLEELNLGGSESMMSNCFSTLRSLDFRRMGIRKGFTINAPLLEKISFTPTWAVSGIFLHRNLLPNLQLLTILPDQRLIGRPDPSNFLYPTIIQDSKSENTKIITLFYDEGIPAGAIKKLKEDLGHPLSFPIQQVEFPLVDPFP